MENIEFIKQYMLRSLAVKQRILEDANLLDAISDVCDLIVECYRRGNKVLFAGNGGSAADSQHLAAEFVSRFYFDRPGLPALALTTDTSMLTAIGNDYGYENLFARQLQAQGVQGDIFIGISTSGNSKNVVKAIDVAKQKGIVSVALCGNTGILASLCDHSLEVPSDSTPNIQECHICIGHIICAIVEERIFGNKDE